MYTLIDTSLKSVFKPSNLNGHPLAMVFVTWSGWEYFCQPLDGTKKSQFSWKLFLKADIRYRDQSWINGLFRSKIQGCVPRCHRYHRCLTLDFCDWKNSLFSYMYSGSDKLKWWTHRISWLETYVLLEIFLRPPLWTIWIFCFIRLLMYC